MVEDGTFRQDLYYRLAKVTLQLPPLRERLDDLSDLCVHFLNQLRERNALPEAVREFGSDALEMMLKYDCGKHSRTAKCCRACGCLL